jgi:hypothetical protein
MRLLPSPHGRISSRHVSAAAAAIAAAQFALCRFDVREQSGRARFAYDLGVTKSAGTMKLIVHGSISGFWNLVDPYLHKASHFNATKADWHRAIDLWLDGHKSCTCCLVRFSSADLDRIPRIYLASAHEIAEKLHESTEQLGDAALYEEYAVTDPDDGSQTIENLPEEWLFSPARIQELLQAPVHHGPLRLRFSSSSKCDPCAAEKSAACLKCLPMMA